MPLNIPNNSAFVVRHQEAFVDLDDRVAAEGKRLVVAANGRELKILPQRSKLGEFFADLFGISTREIKKLRTYLASLPTEESIEKAVEAHKVGESFRKEIGEAYSQFEADKQARTESNRGQHVFGEQDLQDQLDPDTPRTAAFVILNSSESKALNRQADEASLRNRDKNLQDFVSGEKKSPQALEALHQAHRAQRQQGQGLIGREGGLGASKSAIAGTLKEEVKRSSKDSQAKAYGSTQYDPLDRIGELRAPLAGIAEDGVGEELEADELPQVKTAPEPHAKPAVEIQTAEVAAPQVYQYVEPQEGQLCLKHAIAAFCNGPVFQSRDEFLEYRNTIYHTMGDYIPPDSFGREDSDVEAVSNVLNAMQADPLYADRFDRPDQNWVIHEISIERGSKAVDEPNDAKQLNEALERYAAHSEAKRFIIRTGSRYGSGHYSLLNKNPNGSWTLANSVGSSITHGASPAHLIGYERARNMPLYLWTQSDSTQDEFARSIPRQVLI